MPGDYPRVRAGHRRAPRPLRVLFVNTSVSGGGAGKSLVTMLKHLDRARIEPIVLLPEAGSIGASLAYDDIETLYDSLLPERFGRAKLPGIPGCLRNPVSERVINLSLFPRFARHIARIAQQREVDLIHANHVILNQPCVSAGRLANTPVVLHMRDIVSPPERWHFARLAAREPLVRRLVCVSRAVAAQYLATGKTEVIYNTVDLEHFDASGVAGRLRSDFGVPDEQLLLGFFGRLVRWKGVHLLLRAFSSFRNAHPDVNVKLAVVGGNDPSLRHDLLAELQALAHELGIGGDCIFCGFQQDIRPFVVDFDVSVLPSLKPEPFGRAVVEAMALGVPVIASDHGGAAELVKDGYNGLRFAPGDAEALAQALGRLLTDADLRGRMQGNARRYVVQHCDAAAGAERFTRALLAAAG